ncbi:MAG TPA: TlyA family RNA methyltransferase, partial [Levilinea sp.]|nr:TlyA family RNA methyltransferase [Levilinea sp.]
DGQVALKPAIKVSVDVRLEIEKGLRYVSRGGEKLERALQAFGQTDLTGWVCADLGASTGGFTDALLQHGASKVYAIDVGHGLLHWKLRSDARVVSMERTNARFVDRLPEPVQLATVDASFISLKILLPVVCGWFSDAGGEAIALIKPQFEAGRQDTAKGEGVIRDPGIHRQVLLDVLAFAQESGYGVKGLVRSPLVGPKGNAEFLVWLHCPGEKGGDQQVLVDRALAQVEGGGSATEPL